MKNIFKSWKSIVGVLIIIIGTVFLYRFVFSKANQFFDTYGVNSKAISIFILTIVFYVFEIFIGFSLLLSKGKELIASISRYIIGGLFIFSGFVKAIDPLGSTYKFSDYFEAFNVEFLSILAFGLAILLSTAELLIGLCLFLKVRMRTTAWALAIFMLFFTLLTFVIALTNPVSDCGCFGDAIILTNWQTFFKNINFIAPTLIIFLYRAEYSQRFKVKTEWFVVSGLVAAGILLSVYCLRNLPLLDFRPYDVGTHIITDMERPEDAPVDEYETIMIYEKNGARQKFKPEEIPWQDTAWKFVDRETILIKKGYEPPIHNFGLSDFTGYDATYDMLYDPDYSLLIVSHDIAKSSDNGWERTLAFVDSLKNAPLKVYALTSSTENDINNLKEKFNTDIPFYISDAVTLKTIIRANPGVVLVKDGTIIGKWHHSNVPVKELKGDQLIGSAFKYLAGKKGNSIIVDFVLLLFLVLVFTDLKTFKVGTSEN